MAWDGWNWFWGGNEGAVRGRLEEVADKPYGAAALQKLDEVSADGFNMEQELPEVRKVYLSSLLEHVKTLPADKRFDEFRNAVKVVDKDDQFSGPLNAFAQAPENVQQALMNAVAYNPEFVDYLSKSGTANLSGLLTADVLKDPNYSPLIADVLNTIANKPGPPPPQGNGYDFDKLDKLGADAKAYFEEQKKGNKADQEKLAQLQKQLMTSVQDAGGNIPPLMNMDLEKFMKFLHNLMNGDMNAAINGLGKDLGLDGEQLAQFRDVMEMPASILKFMGQDYYEFGMYYGPRVVADGTEYFNKVDGLMNGVRVQGPQVAAADIELPTQGAAVDYSDMKFTQTASVSGQGLAGVTKMTDGTTNNVLAGVGITPNVTPEQERAVAAYDAQTDALRRSAPSFTPPAAFV